MSKPKSKQEEALQFLDDLDSMTPEGATGTGGTTNEAEVLAFVDEITQKSSEPPRPTTTANIDRPSSRAGTPNLRKSTERVRLGGGLASASSSTGSLGKTSDKAKAKAKAAPEPVPASAPAGGSWGWGSVWSAASAAVQQARTVVDEQVKQLPSNEQAKKWREGVMEYAKNAQLEKIGQDFKRVGLSTLTDILNAVAPPISEHEVIQIWLSHDMQGYNGVESLVYRAMSRIMEQVEGGDLIVNKGDESKPKETNSERNLDPVDGYAAAIKLARTELEHLAKNNKKAEITEDPNSMTTYSHVYLRIQPFCTEFECPDPDASSMNITAQLQFLLYLYDPSHKLTHISVTQTIPVEWFDLWDKYSWVEDSVAEGLRVGVEVVGQEYLVARMGWGDAPKAEQEDEDEETEEEESGAEES